MTIPKDVREFFGGGYEFWLKLYIENGKAVIEPLEQKPENREVFYNPQNFVVFSYFRSE